MVFGYHKNKIFRGDLTSGMLEFEGREFEGDPILFF
jgi:hypothetical protein